MCIRDRSGDAVGHPVPTNDWWSNVLYKDQSENIFAYPMGMRTRADGLTLAYIPKGAMVDFSPVHISVGNITSYGHKNEVSKWLCA